MDPEAVLKSEWIQKQEKQKYILFIYNLDFVKQKYGLLLLTEPAGGRRPYCC